MEDSEYEEEYMDDSCDDTSEVDDEPCFDAEDVPKATLPYTVLDPTACAALAQKEMQAVIELLCCNEEVAGILMRQFRWNREKLTEGAASQSAIGPNKRANVITPLQSRQASPTPSPCASAPTEYLCDSDKVLKRAGIHSGANCEVIHFGEDKVLVGGVEQVTDWPILL